jgi:hypothetical protein
MQNKDTYSSTKDAALRAVGVVSEKQRKALATEVEFVRVRAGRQLLTRGGFAPTVVIGVAGAVLVTKGDGHVAKLEAPFVIDSWAADERRVADLTVVANEATSLLLIDWSRRESVFAEASELRKLSAHTFDELEASSEKIILRTEEAPQPVK